MFSMCVNYYNVDATTFRDDLFRCKMLQLPLIKYPYDVNLQSNVCLRILKTQDEL